MTELTGQLPLFTVDGCEKETLDMNETEECPGCQQCGPEDEQPERGDDGPA